MRELGGSAGGEREGQARESRAWVREGGKGGGRLSNHFTTPVVRSNFAMHHTYFSSEARLLNPCAATMHVSRRVWGAAVAGLPRRCVCAATSTPAVALRRTTNPLLHALPTQPLRRASGMAHTATMCRRDAGALRRVVPVSTTRGVGSGTHARRCASTASRRVGRARTRSCMGRQSRTAPPHLLHVPPAMWACARSLRRRRRLTCACGLCGAQARSNMVSEHPLAFAGLAGMAIVGGYVAYMYSSTRYGMASTKMYNVGGVCVCVGGWVCARACSRLGWGGWYHASGGRAYQPSLRSDTYVPTPKPC